VAGAPPPSTAAAAVALAGNGAGGDPPSSSGPATAVVAPPPALDENFRDPAPVAPAEPSGPFPRVPLRPAGPQAQSRPAPAGPPRRPGAPDHPSRVGRVVAILLTLLAIGVAVAVLLIVTSGGGNSAKSGSTATTNSPAKHHHGRVKPFDTAAVTVAVLNGTSTSGLAAHVSHQLGALGYKQGPTTNAADQTQTTTTVFYLPGHRKAAVEVAKALKLPNSRVTAIDSGTQAIACQGATSCPVDVVVTLGADLANQ
jgi:LytR cell envelope-related transcriptional attenuator